MAGIEYRVQRYGDANTFAAVALPFLERDEVANNLQIGITRRAQKSGTPRFCFLATVHDTSGNTVAVATQNPGHQLLLSAIPVSAVTVVANELLQVQPTIPGVLGPPDAVDALVACLGRPVQARFPQDIWRLSAVTAIAPPDGNCDPATSSNEPLAEAWLRSFCTEAGIQPPPPGRVSELVSGGALFFWWHDSTPRSMAAIVRESSTGATISFVYTPLEYRGRGYASACVASVCRTLLARGKAMVSLHSDPSNTRATAVYHRVGFCRVARTVRVTFA